MHNGAPKAQRTSGEAAFSFPSAKSCCNWNPTLGGTFPQIRNLC
jgi:hypothetical protein